MNERIKKLAEQAGFNVAASEQQHNGQILRNSLERFTELLLKDVAQFVEDKFDFCGDEIVIAEKIREHFGVEE